MLNLTPRLQVAFSAQSRDSKSAPAVPPPSPETQAAIDTFNQQLAQQSENIRASQQGKSAAQKVDEVGLGN